MSEKRIPKELIDFIGARIQSVEQIEILSLFVENPSRLWSFQEVFRSIQSTEKSVQESLEYFVGQKLIGTDQEGCFRFMPDGSDLTRLSIDLIKIYRERRVSVIELIYRRPSGSAQTFANAFRLRKDQ
jgi:hypothetical protein